MIRRLLACMLALSPTFQARGQDAAAEQRHWAAELGRRSFASHLQVPVVDQVVLVPDAATYLDELSRWSLDGRWPVLIEDDIFTPMFVRRFGPAAIIRRESVGQLPAGRSARQTACREAVRSAWVNADTSEGTPYLELLRARGLSPSGLVISSTDDSAWPAAIALAAGRGQILDFIDGFHRGPNGVLNPPDATKLRTAIIARLDATGLEYADLGDTIDAITMCRDMAGAIRSEAPGAKPPSPGKPALLASTDVIGRHADGRRFAVVGWIFGSETRSAYVAMCSLFLTCESGWLFDTYGDQVTPYSLQHALGILEQIEMPSTLLSGPDASLTTWRQVSMRPIRGDVLLINTKGNDDFFDTSAGRGNTGHIPIPGGPAVLQFIHSWSMRRPADPATIGARWLDHGVYAMVGSVQEPYLSAFVPSGEVMRRCAVGVPFLAAVRWFPEQGSGVQPWRVQTYGDPLMIARPFPPSQRAQPRSRDDAAQLNDDVRDQMKACDSDPSDEAFGTAVRTLVLLGRDDIAIGLWRVAVEKDMALRASRAVLPALFAGDDDASFTRAALELVSRDPMAVDMLWLRLSPRLDSRTSDDVLLLLQSSVRAEIGYHDLSTLRRHLQGRFGQAHFQRLVDRLIEQTDHAGRRRRLNSLLR